MKVHIRQIRAQGINIEETFNAEWIGLTRKDNICFVDPIKVEAKVTKVDDEMFVDITANSCYESFCYRCLQDISKDWSWQFLLNFDLDKSTEFIEIDEDIRQEILLNLPTRVLCSQDCKGLCIDCGNNLNKKECEHNHSVVTNKK